jgi:hypothetical protein
VNGRETDMEEAEPAAACDIRCANGKWPEAA